MSPTLAELSGWSPAPLQSQATGLAGAHEQLSRGRDRLRSTLAVLPEVWEGVAATAVRRALHSEIAHTEAYLDAVAALRALYDGAARDLSDALTSFREMLAGFASGPLVVDLASPAAGPVTVRASGRSGVDGGVPDEAELQAAANAVAGAAAAVLRVDAETAAALVGLAAVARDATATEPDGTVLDGYLDTKSLASHRFPEFGFLDHDTNAAVRGFVLDLVPSGTLADSLVTFATNVHENRVSPGDGIVEVLEANIDDLIPLKRWALGPLDSASKLVSGTLWPEAANGVNLTGAVVDGAVRPAARWADGLFGTEFFVDDSELASRALRDAERYGGW